MLGPVFGICFHPSYSADPTAIVRSTHVVVVVIAITSITREGGEGTLIDWSFELVMR